MCLTSRATGERQDNRPPKITTYLVCSVHCSLNPSVDNDIRKKKPLAPPLKDAGNCLTILKISKQRRRKSSIILPSLYESHLKATKELVRRSFLLRKHSGWYTKKRSRSKTSPLCSLEWRDHSISSSLDGHWWGIRSNPGLVLLQRWGHTTSNTDALPQAKSTHLLTHLDLTPICRQNRRQRSTADVFTAPQNRGADTGRL